MNVLDLARQAGPLLWVLLALSLYVIYLVVARLLVLLRLGQDATPLIERSRALVTESGPEMALREVDLSGLDIPAAQVLRAGLRRADRGAEGARAAMQSALIEQEGRVFTGLSTLGTAAQVAPLLGLLGTVMGMVKSFLVFSQTTTPTPNQLASGISEALINTAAGLLVAIVAYVARNALRSRAETVMSQAEQVSEEVPTWLMPPLPRTAAPAAPTPAQPVRPTVPTARL